MKVLITGAGGFIGSHLVAAELEAGHSVVAVDLHLERLSRWQAISRLELVQHSISDIAAMKKLLVEVDTVYHLASAHLDVSLSDEAYYEVNVSATVRLATAAREIGVRRFVHCSSVGVMGHIDNPPANELASCHPGNVYGKSKLAGEKAVLALAREKAGFIVVVRPAWVYGPSCPRTERLFRMVRKGRFPIFGDGQNMRHPIYVADLVKGLQQSAVEDDAVDELFILAGERPVTLTELLGTIAAVCDVPAAPVSSSPDIWPCCWLCSSEFLQSY